MLRITQVKMPITHTEEDLRIRAAKLLRVSDNQIKKLVIVRQSIDARKRDEISFSYVLDAEVEQEEKIVRRCKNDKVSLSKEISYRFPASGSMRLNHRPVIVGSGPAGLFCGLMLARHGYNPLIFERGGPVQERKEKVEAFWKDGTLDVNCNVQFGEGGAGTFSDGKLNTLVKDPNGRNRLVLSLFAEFGADPSITWVHKPHIGTDVLMGIVKGMREEIIRLGGEVRFYSQVTDILFKEAEDLSAEAEGMSGEVQKPCQRKICGVVVNGKEEIPTEVLVLAIGHSARDTFFMLNAREIPMEAKAFAVGLRIQHPQEMIDASQYGQEAAKILGAASYKLTHTCANGRGVYSFCMCPGGFVVNASSEEGRLAVNGMSYHARDGENANSALIVTVTPEDFLKFVKFGEKIEEIEKIEGIEETKGIEEIKGKEETKRIEEIKEIEKEESTDVLAGIAFQRVLEERAFRAGKGKVPVQLYGDFKENRCSVKFGAVKPQIKGEMAFANLQEVLPVPLVDALIEGIERFGRVIPGFHREDALLAGVESRTSSPVRILRDKQLESSVLGLFPCGEGAGYAGGITSAAMDGIKVAEEIARRFGPGSEGE